MIQQLSVMKLLSHTMKKNAKFLILLTFILITIALLIAVSIYHYLMKYRAKQKNLLPFHATNLH